MIRFGIKMIVTTAILYHLINHLVSCDLSAILIGNDLKRFFNRSYWDARLVLLLSAAVRDLPIAPLGKQFFPP